MPNITSTFVKLSTTPASASVLGMALLQFMYFFIGSVAIGLAIGCMSALVRHVVDGLPPRRRRRPPADCAVRARATLIGVAPAAQLLKYVQFRRYPSLELALVFVFAYAPYVTAEGVGLSGTRAGDPQRANAYGRHGR